jgi:hypothetical protein
LSFRSDRRTPSSRRVLPALAISTIAAFSACSGGGGTPPGTVGSLPSVASAQPPPVATAATGPALKNAAPQPAGRGRKKPHTPSVLLTAAFSPASASVGTPVLLTITLQNGTSSDVVIGKFTDNLPQNSFGRMYVAANPQPSSTCQGTFNPIPGTWSVDYSGGTIPASSQCTISVYVAAGATGQYVNASATLVSVPSGAVLVVERRAFFTALAPQSDHLYVPISSSGEVQEYVGGTGGGGSPVCTITSSAFPKPNSVATNPFTGDLYVFDPSKNTISVVAWSPTCPSGPVTPKQTIVPVYNTGSTVGMAIDSNGDLVTTESSNGLASGCDCSRVVWYTPAGNAFSISGQGSVNSVFGSPTADIAGHGLYVMNFATFGVYRFDTSGSTPQQSIPWNTEFANGGPIAFGDGNVFEGYSNTCPANLHGGGGPYGEVDDDFGPNNYMLATSCFQPLLTRTTLVRWLAFDGRANVLAVLTQTPRTTSIGPSPVINPPTPVINYWIDSAMTGNVAPHGSYSAGLGTNPNAVGQPAYGW